METEQRCVFCGKAPEQHPEGHKPLFLKEPTELPRWSRLRAYDGAAVLRPGSVVVKPVQR